MKNAGKNSRLAGTVLLAGMMFTVSLMMVMATGASGIQDTDSLTPDGFWELLKQQSTGVFIENGGQWDETIRFAATTSFGHIAFGDDHIIFDVRAKPQEDGTGSQKTSFIPGTVIRMDLHGCRDIEPQGRDPLPYRTNILYGKDPAGWGKNLVSYRKIVYQDIWDGIDLVYDTTEGNIKYEYRVGPGADLEDISFSFEGLESVKVRDRSIQMTTSNVQNLMDDGLFSYHEGMPGKEIPSRFTAREDGTIGYEVDGRDRTRTLVIDPVIYGTYIGGSDDEYDVDMAIDGSGACYLAGSTWSFDFPTTPGAYSTWVAGENDGFVMKIYPDGSSPVYSTYIGGVGYDSINSIAVDNNGYAYVAGSTDSWDFPTTRGAFNETMNGSGQDLIVFKLDQAGSNLVYSTYMGGTSWENMNDPGCIAVDNQGCAYIVGSSNSKDFPLTYDAFDKENNNTMGGDLYGEEYRTSKAVVVKLKADGSDLEYSTYLGGTMDEYTNGIALDDEGMVYILGTTGSKDFPVTKGAFDTSMDSFWGGEIFLAKIDIDGSRIVYATYLGGSESQNPTDIAIDSSGRPYICGFTGSNDFPVKENTYQHELNGWMDIFVTAFDPTFSSLYMSTFIGGSEGEQAYSIDLDGEGNVMITGSTASPDYPTIVTHATPQSNQDGSVLISVFDPQGMDLLYSTLVGGSAGSNYPEDVGFNIFSVADRRVVVSGYTGCTDFPITDNAYDDSLDGWADLFLMEFDLSLPPSAPGNISLFQGDGYLNISWDLPEDDGGMPITGYIVYRGLREDDMKVQSSSVEGQYFKDTDLDMGKTYYYMVRAFNPVGTGLPSGIVSSQAASSPTPPQFFRVQKGNGWVRLTWEPPVFDGSYSLKGYRIYKSVESEEWNTIDLESIILEYYDTDVLNGANYSYRMTTWNIIGESLSTNELWAIPQGEASAPTHLSVQNESGSIILTWDIPDDDGGSEILYYRVHIGITKGSEIYWRYVNAPTTEYTDTLVEIGKTYLYYVTAVNVEGESAPSEQVVGLPQSEPSPPTNVQISEGNGYLLITWETPSFLGGIDLQGFTLYRSEGSGVYILIGEFSFDEFLYKDKNVTNGHSYTYKMTAFNAFGISDETSGFVGTPAAVPESPGGLAAAAGDGAIGLQWNPPYSDGGAPVIEYMIYRKVSEGGLDQIGVATNGSISFTDSDVEGGTAYTYAVKARNRMGASPFSDEVEVMALGRPGTPLNVVYVTGDGFVEISWEMPATNGGSPITGYRILRSDTELHNILTIAEPGPEELSWRDESVHNGESYIYTVNAVNDIGVSLSAWTDPVTPLGVPGIPMALVLSADGNRVTMTWSGPTEDGGSDVLFYRIYRVREGGAPELIGVVEAGTFSFTDEGEKEDGTYTYMVAAVNSIGESKTAAEDNIEVDAKGEPTGFFEKNIGLLFTLPIIVLLLILLVLVIVRKKREGDSNGTMPLPSVVEEEEDTNGYPNGYQEEPLLEEAGGDDQYVQEFNDIDPQA
ncbi:MAG: fibronectin type III domain-containing protein [Candidatus Thermoplasmatota archaeon]|nr:fibronectin type III domain-containing protein [Candidatus Thermoplasmatota archaeon]